MLGNNWRKTRLRGTSTEKIHQQLDLESLKSRGWFRKLCHFRKIFNEKSPLLYLFILIANFNRVRNTRFSSPMKVRYDYFKNSFFSSAITEWNKFDLNIRNSARLSAFKKNLLNFILPPANSIVDIHNPIRIKLLTRLRLGLSHLHEHNFRHFFQNTFNPYCKCGKYIELTMHLFIHCIHFLIPRQTLQTLLHGNQDYHSSINMIIFYFRFFFMYC